MLIAKMAYEDYCASKNARNELNMLLVDIGKKKVHVTTQEKNELYTIKDTSVKTTQYLYDRMIAFEHKTATLRDKIGYECGNRGKAWYKKIMANRKQT